MAAARPAATTIRRLRRHLSMIDPSTRMAEAYTMDGSEKKAVGIRQLGRGRRSSRLPAASLLPELVERHDLLGPALGLAVLGGRRGIARGCRGRRRCCLEQRLALVRRDLLELQPELH